jgi:hypothetical protein
MNISLLLSSLAILVLSFLLPYTELISSATVYRENAPKRKKIISRIEMKRSIKPPCERK